MLYVAREDGPERHRGAVVRVEASPFAPSELLLRDHASTAVDSAGYIRRSVWVLRQLWRTDGRVILDTIALTRTVVRRGNAKAFVNDKTGKVDHVVEDPAQVGQMDFLTEALR